MSNILKIFVDGLWKKNSSLVQLLGLCPVLAITVNAINAIGLGLATTLVLICSNATISLIKNNIQKDFRIPIYIIIISSVVSSIDLVIKAYAFNLYQSLGIFIPLIITNCIVCNRADLIAVHNSVLVSILDGLSIGLGSTLTMFLLGSIREIIGHGTLFFGIEHVLGESFRFLYIEVLDKNSVFLLFAFPSGAFMILGIVLAGKNFLDEVLGIIEHKNVCVCSNKVLVYKDGNKKIESQKSL
ncbi:electron transport complex protein rnfE [Buchnera aphidicola str. Bp (Baizongia pistaciae)]|uniref:Ion-translocating oxidoreductase complex subunit E n=1 Tax=Buchnera aphidicola subsp. Baizongia pistaciae (strain Bp) TaxID=224915 RepID=RNFE_BUCBP|nr:electron transport complex subunit E [Buchnera aphidicola]Q89AW5.1 RecName: Full=Ion-translocating oxidoreductase complex subunit E; AltName: Full=Rnf electron transport complex subunit E [Buchnera aphidicola str. Bp (Baizongia pistaciae)]AAO26847.1 electron transport complex protein rnfE [Buchnera aphidicola str. Bp (Baizongia pistaciae)]